MPGAVNESLRRKALALLVVEGCFYALMVGTAETFALYFSIQRGLDASQIAVISTLPILLGAVGQWLIPCRVPGDKLKLAMQGCLLLQISALFGFILAFRVVPANYFYLFMLASLSLYWIGGLIAAPLWLDWTAPWLPQRRWGNFLASRNGIIAFMTLLAYVSGAWLTYSSGLALLDAVAVVFSIGIVARTLSLFTMRATPNPPRRRAQKETSSASPRLRDSKAVLGIIVFTVLFKWAVNISSPFCLPYLLHELKLDLPQYVFLTAVPFIGRYVSLTNWGLAARTLRPFVGVQVAMAVISINPILWSLTREVPILGSYEFVSGLMWGGFDLCAVLVVQNFWPGNTRRLIGLHMALGNGAALLGAWMGSRFQLAGWNYEELFFLSANFRFTVTCAFSVFLWSIPETRIPLKVYGNFLTTVLTLRPSIANVGRILPMTNLRRKINPFLKKGL